MIFLKVAHLDPIPQFMNAHPMSQQKLKCVTLQPCCTHIAWSSKMVGRCFCLVFCKASVVKLCAVLSGSG